MWMCAYCYYFSIIIIIFFIVVFSRTLFSSCADLHKFVGTNLLCTSILLGSKTQLGL